MIGFPHIQQGRLTFQDMFPACHLKLTVPSALTVRSQSLPSDAPSPGPLHWLVSLCGNATFSKAFIVNLICHSFVTLWFCFVLMNLLPRGSWKLGNTIPMGKMGKLRGGGDFTWLSEASDCEALWNASAF